MTFRRSIRDHVDGIALVKPTSAETILEQEARERGDAAIQTKHAFLAIVSHKVRARLQAFLAGVPLQESPRRHRETLRSSSERCGAHE
jgi:hypothetical protein